VGIGSTAYKVVFVLHVLAVIVGFGTVCLNGIRGAEAKKRPGPGGLAIGESGFRVNQVAEKFIYAVPVLGLALVGMSDGVWEFGQTWVWLSLVLYVIGIGVSHSVLIPSEPAGGPPPQVVEMEGLEKKLAGAGTFLNVLVVVVVALMIFKPGI
jgi:hypothetical protein